jgi:TonB family protein
MLCNLAVVCGLAFSFATPAMAQAVSNNAAQIDPKALALAAAAANGVLHEDAKPWHIKISYTTNTPDGKPGSAGTFEEFWAGPSKYKRIFVSPTFNQVEYGTADGPRRTGTPDGAPDELARIVDAVLNPIPLDAASISAAKLQAQPLALGQAKLMCVTAALAAAGSQPASTTSYCVDESSPVLRLTVANGGVSRTTHDSIVKFQGRSVAKMVDHYGAPSGPPPKPGVEPAAPKPDFSAKVESLEVLDPVDEAALTAPADAVAAPKVIALDEKTTKKQLLQHPMAEYPQMAHWQHVGGVVVVALRVQSDGRVSNLRVVSGHPLLQQAALDAIGKWTYKPFVVEGQPVEVDTTASTTFNLMP